MYDVDVCKAAGTYRKQDECSNNKTNINRKYSGNNRGGDTRDQREVREYQGYISLDSVARKEAHDSRLDNDREAESDIRRVVTRGVGQSDRLRMREMGSWFRDARSRQALDRVRGTHDSLRKFLQKEHEFLVYIDQQENWCIRMRHHTGRVGMDQQGITRKELLRVSVRQEKSRSFQGALQMFMEDRDSSTREKIRLTLYYHRQKRLPWGVQECLLQPLVGVSHVVIQIRQIGTGWFTGLERECATPK